MPRAKNCSNSRFCFVSLPTLQKIPHGGRRLAAANRSLEAFDSGLDRHPQRQVLPRTDQLLLQANGTRRTRHEPVEPSADRIIQVAIAHHLVDQSPRMRLRCGEIFAEQEDLASSSQ